MLVSLPTWDDCPYSGGPLLKYSEPKTAKLSVFVLFSDYFHRSGSVFVATEVVRLSSAHIVIVVQTTVDHHGFHPNNTKHIV